MAKLNNQIKWIRLLHLLYFFCVWSLASTLRIIFQIMCIFKMFNSFLCYVFFFSAILQRNTVDVGQIRLIGIATCLYLCMDSCGNLYSTVCIFGCFCAGFTNIANKFERHNRNYTGKQTTQYIDQMKLFSHRITFTASQAMMKMFSLKWFWPL